ncbi:hypothetical protein [Pseudogemmobacter sonorensis]|uniref:hypothetical protein n=1 Tax=Pseudogemmobacter sonorensis TaxID=2989681 RepID=UPI00368C07F1
MTSLAISDLGSEYDRIFGQKPEDAGAGRQRLCRVCGGWHRLDAWPHNCRSEAPRRNRDLAAPQLAPRFDEFRTGLTETAEIIGDRRSKREFMDRHDLVEWDDGVQPDPGPTERQWKEDFVHDFKRAQQEDPLNRPPVDVIGQTDTGGAGEIDITSMEIST